MSERAAADTVACAAAAKGSPTLDDEDADKDDDNDSGEDSEEREAEEADEVCGRFAKRCDGDDSFTADVPRAGDRRLLPLSVLLPIPLQLPLPLPLLLPPPISECGAFWYTRDALCAEAGYTLDPKRAAYGPVGESRCRGAVN